MGGAEGLSQRERRLLDDIERELAPFQPERPATKVAPLIRELLAVNIVALVTPELEPDGVVLERMDTDGETLARYLPDLVIGLRSGKLSFAFNVRAPEPMQRNRPVAFPGARSWRTNPRLGLSGPESEARWKQVGDLVTLHDRHGIADHHQLRTLICDGPLVLRYFNVIHEAPLSARQHRLYRAVLASLRRRALFEHRLASAESYRVALEAALDALAGAAFITDRSGRVAHANRLGTAMLGDEPDLPRRLAGAIAGCDPSFTAHPLVTTGAPVAYLLTARRATLVEAARTVAAELGLGDRATEVLALVAAAQPTKLIAARLRIAENTVEYHLTSLFRRMGASSRAEVQQLLADRLTR